MAKTNPEPAKARPVHEVRIGLIKGAIWANQTDDAVRHNVTFERSYKDGEDYVFSDPETYETVTITPELVGDGKSYMVENGQVTMTFVDDKAVQIELPPSVVLKVTDAPDGVRGDSANNVQKTVTMETGITVQAPLFIKTGEKLKIDTRTGKYMERA